MALSKEDCEALEKIGVNKCREYVRIIGEFEDAHSDKTDAMIVISELSKKYPDIFGGCE